jgi:serine palmitoyltransferase
MAIALPKHSYLGFGTANPCENPGFEPALASLQSHGVAPASTRSCMGGALMIEQLEQELASFLGQPSVVVFGQGFATNSCGISCLFGPGDLLLSDSLNHSSIVVGARLSGAKVKPFRHAGMHLRFYFLCNCHITSRHVA